MRWILLGLFLLLIAPIQVGAALRWSGNMPSLTVGVLIWGVVLSAAVGYFSLALLLRALKGRWFWLFGPYCIVAGLLTVCFC